MATYKDKILISGDSHFGEPLDLWQKNLPARFKDRAPNWPDLKEFVTNHHLREGCWEPHARLKDMAVDGVSAEVLYPTQGAQLFAIGDVDLEKACATVYNDYCIDFCSVSHDRLWGLGIIPTRDIDFAVSELERVKKGGLNGAAIAIAPPAELPYSDEHYEKFWQAAEALNMPLAMHINTRAKTAPNYEHGRTDRAGRILHSINGHKNDAQSSLGHLISGGVMERYPKLQFSVAEIGVGWVPFWLQEFDYYATSRMKLAQLPSEYFERAVTSTFISDAVGGVLAKDYPFLQYNAMWSSDYPHPACIWPDSIEIMEADLGALDPAMQEVVVCTNAARVFNGGKLPPTAEKPADDYEADTRLWAKEHGDFGNTSRLKNAFQAGRAHV
ncbi:MAG: hypothetical protein EXR58_04745 [Chloroflexi bacterium]|nr:hypothetical protein [Chloroflexota bacterium]